MPEIMNRPLRADADMVAVIMAGGSGTRFWPESRRSRPKQFLPLGTSDKSLLEATNERLQGLSEKVEVMVVTAEDQASLVAACLPQVSILSEPFPRNTAACLGFAAKRVLRDIGDVPMVCLPADHDIEGDEGLRQVFRQAAEHAKSSDVLVTIGIKPSHPETGFGYLECGERIGQAYRVARFVEKPSREKAQSYLESGRYFWNSGMFVWRPSVVLNAIGAFMPRLSDTLEEIESCFDSIKEYEKIHQLYDGIEKKSIDFGVMEKAPNVLMVSGDSFAWSDVGSWQAWAERLSGKDPEGNAGLGDCVFVNCSDTAAKSKSKTIALVGLSGVVVVETDDALLVCAKDAAQDVKKVIEELEKRGRKELL